MFNEIKGKILLKPIFSDNEIKFDGIKPFFNTYIKTILRINLFFILIFFIYFFIKPTIYQSKVSFYTNYNEAPQSSFLSMLPAGMLGGGLGYSSLSFSIQNYLSSEIFLNYIVNEKYIINDKEVTLVEEWGSDYNNFLTLNPLTILKRINFNLGFNSGLSSNEKKEIYAASILKNSLLFSEDRRSLMNTISINIKHDSLLGKQIIENIYNSIISYSSKVVNIKANEKKQFISQRLTEVTKSLEESEDAMLSFLQENKQIQNSPTLTLQKQRLQKDITLYNQLYFTLSDQLELAKINEKDNTTSFFLLDAPLTFRTTQDGSFAFNLIKSLLIINLIVFSILFIRNKNSLIRL